VVRVGFSGQGGGEKGVTLLGVGSDRAEASFYEPVTFGG
jgi:hypothetical protein